MTSAARIRYNIGHCPACETEIYANATVEIEAPTHTSAPDIRLEKKVDLKGKITGAVIDKHDCNKAITR